MILQFQRFLFSGGTATLLHWAILWMLMVAGCPPVPASALGACGGATANYWLQYHVTFRSVTAHRNTIPGFLVVSGMSLVMNSSIFYALHTLAQWSPAVSQVITSGLVAIANFLTFKTLVFHDRCQPLR